ncbi:MAG: hypothetical protein WBA28_08730 [Microbacteriaceae bacterium]
MMKDERHTQNATAYLMQLAVALAEVPAITRDEILAAVSDELLGLDAEQVEAKIALLGDPDTIALNAQEESLQGNLPKLGEALPQGFIPSVVESNQNDPLWYSVVTVLLLTIGGFVVPVLGWIAGVVMLWASKTWVLKHKIIGTVLAPGVLMLVAILGLTFWQTGSVMTEQIHAFIG